MNKTVERIGEGGQLDVSPSMCAHCGRALDEKGRCTQYLLFEKQQAQKLAEKRQERQG